MVSRRTFLVAAAVSARPNKVLFLADDLGSCDVACYGAVGENTPHIDG